MDILFTNGWSNRSRVPSDAEFMHFFVDAGSGDAEDASGPGHVPVLFVERDQDGLRLAALDHGLELAAGFGVFGGDGLMAQLLREVRQRDLVVLAQAQGPDDHVAEFADVAGPRVAHEHVHGADGAPDSVFKLCSTTLFSHRLSLLSFTRIRILTLRLSIWH